VRLGSRRSRATFGVCSRSGRLHQLTFSSVRLGPRTARSRLLRAEMLLRQPGSGHDRIFHHVFWIAVRLYVRQFLLLTARVEGVLHFAQEFRRKKRLFQNTCADLYHLTEFGKFVSKASNKQELHLGMSDTNLLRQLKAGESGHDNITHHKGYCAIVFPAQAESLYAVGGRKDREPSCFERPLQKVSKVVVVFD
jgi:hypothetical protein